MGRTKKAAHKLMKQYGINDPTEIPLEYLAAMEGGVVIEKSLDNADGRIVRGNKKAMILIDSGIQFQGKKRFTIAHEIGHLVMHKDEIPIHNDIEYLQKGPKEREANRFASELLMPKALFKDECKGRMFGPDLLRELADRFRTSVTATTFKYFDIGNHPICLFYSRKNKVKYWKRPNGYPHYIKNRVDLSPPGDSVAAEYFKEGKIYSREESKQEVRKSTWFELNYGETDKTFYEYCIVYSKHDTVLSVVWED